MRLVAADWGTSRLRAFLIDGDAVLGRASSEDGVARLRPGAHAAAFGRLAGPWLAAEPGLPVVLAGMVGSREGWFPAGYAATPAGPGEIAALAFPVDLGLGGGAIVVPGVSHEERGGIDVMRGEETQLLGSGVADGLCCLPGTHTKWAEMRGGRIRRFATFMTGEMHGLLREHSVIGRPATEPADAAGFGRGLDAAGREGAAASLLHDLFRARAAAVTGWLAPAALGPYLSGLLTGAEVAGALALFGRPAAATVVAEPARAALYAEALGRHGVATAVVDPEPALIAGIRRILAAR